MILLRLAPVLAAGAGLFALGACQMSGSNAMAGSACVLDSETIAIAAPRQVETRGVTACKGGNRVKLAGIVAPATGEPHGALATAVLAGLADGEVVTCQNKGSSGGMSLVSCQVRGRDLGREFVERGGALACSDADPTYRDAEKQAQSARRGLWALNWLPAAGSCRKS